MKDFIIAVLSFSFQISGALILLNWCSSNIDRRVKERYLQQHKGLILVGPDDDMKIQLRKEELQKNATAIFKSCAAAFNITLGYILAVFMEGTGSKKECLILQILICVVAILLIEHYLTVFVARKKYPEDILLAHSEMTKGIAAYRHVSK